MRELVTYDHFKKKDILNELSNIETDYYTIYEAYIIRNIVYIRGRFKPGISGEININLLPKKYAPESLIHGNWGYSYAMDNITRIGYVRVEYNGNINIWIDNIYGGENFTIQYPLKV